MLEVISFVNNIRHRAEGDNWTVTLGLETSTGFVTALPDIDTSGLHPLGGSAQFTLNRSQLDGADTLG